MMSPNSDFPSSQALVEEYVRLLRQPLPEPVLENVPAIGTNLPERSSDRPCALLFTPHPDDECLTGVLPLRLMREENWQIVNIAITLGSTLARRAGRKAELAKACGVLGWNCVLAADEGFSNINMEARNANPAEWRDKAAKLAKIVAHYQPQLIFMPHANDWNPTHVGTYHLGIDALSLMPRDFTCRIAFMEYWQPMDQPNTMIGIGEADVAHLMSALACHACEVARNPYDRRFPAHLIDNVRRGSERLSGKGAAAPAMDFAEMYRIGMWLKGTFIPSALNRFVAADQTVATLFD